MKPIQPQQKPSPSKHAPAVAAPSNSSNQVVEQLKHQVKMKAIQYYQVRVQQVMTPILIQMVQVQY